MNDFINGLFAFHRVIIVIEKALLFLILFSMIIISFGQVIARNIFDQGYMWVDIFLRHGVIWIAFLGASLATEYRQHIKIDVFSHMLSTPYKRKQIEIAISVFQMVICALLAIGSIEYVMMLKEYPTYDFKWFPVWGLRMIVPFSFVVMIVSCFSHIVNTLAGRSSPTITYDSESIMNEK
ncbi:MAG: TRAP transporter small permease [Proteobacteria bacterium]|nr:TRAP transporter small permease [Pseudomonadota bacterium]